MPPTSVYFVWPRFMAWIAASLMRSGVSKSGSPAPNEITFTPRARSSLALAWTARVDDGARLFIRSASTARTPAGPRPARRPSLRRPLRGELLAQPLFHDRGDEAGDRLAEARHLLDEARRDVRVLLVGHQEHGLHGAAQLADHERHLELVLEVRDGADAAHDAVGALARHQVDGETRERDDAKVLVPRGGLVDHLHPLG